MGLSAASNWSHIPSSSHTGKKKKSPGQKSWDVFKEEEEIHGVKRKGWVCRADTFHNLFLSGSGEAMKARVDGPFASTGMSCRAVGAQAPTHLRCLSGICLLPLAKNAGIARKWRKSVLLCVSEGIQKLRIRHKTLRPKLGRHGKIFGLPWKYMIAALLSEITGNESDDFRLCLVTKAVPYQGSLA